MAPSSDESVTLNTKDDGYRGVWYMNQPSHDEYVYKYSGGLGTYCAKHIPFAVYRAEVHKTFFCYGGAARGSHLAYSAADAVDYAKLEKTGNAGRLLHMVSYYDHATGCVPRPTILLDKLTGDAHDNPVMAIDERGHIWIFSTSHGRSRPSYIHRSVLPYDVDDFELIKPTCVDDGERVPMTNFSYMQVRYVPGTGFVAFFTRYQYPATRTLCFMTSPDGQTWSDWQRLGAIEEGHYQVSNVGVNRAGTFFNMHPAGQGVNWRTNLYYLETRDNGKSWQTIAGEPMTLPLTERSNAALVYDYAAEDLKVYMKDMIFTPDDEPVVLYITSKGYESGPGNNPRTWTTARWDGRQWIIRPAMTSDNNYDTGSLSIDADGTWRIIGPTETGPQPFNPGGEMALWVSRDQGETWVKVKDMTGGSPRNHTYARRPESCHSDFRALWADGHGREPSESRIYFSDADGNARILPEKMQSDLEVPELL